MLLTISLHCLNLGLRAMLETQLRSEGCIVTMHGEVNVTVDVPSGTALFERLVLTRTVFVTDNPCHEHWLDVLESGVMGFIAGSANWGSLLEAVQCVHHGQQYQKHAVVLSRLKPAQRKVLRLVALTLDNKSIADKLGVKPQTVRDCISEILEELRSSHPELLLKNSRQLAFYYWGLWHQLQTRVVFAPLQL